MKAPLPGLLLLAALLIIPFALRPPQPLNDPDAEPLVVLTPHNASIRNEMARGFSALRRELHQRPVRIDWRSPGGTTEISRYLASEFRSTFEQHWLETRGRELSELAARRFSDPRQTIQGESEPARARRAFLSSNVGIRVDLLFGGGSYDFSQHAAAGRLVDSGIVAAHPQLFGPGGIPQVLGGEPYWDPQGRWIGVCLSGFGLCQNPEALARLGIHRPLTQWSDLSDPRLFGHVALADPSKAGSANKAFEMIVQQAMAQAVSEAGSPERGSPAEDAALAKGFEAGMRLIRYIGANARYFSDQAGKVPQDVQAGAAAAGMCIDFYGRVQSEEGGASSRLDFTLPKGGSSIGSDPIALLRGAPRPDLARAFMEFVLSPRGQALWAFKPGVPGGPQRHALRRLPILPSMYAPALRPLRSDPQDNPYAAARHFNYHPRWTGPLFRALSFVIRLMCVESEDELQAAAEALLEARHAPRARALFEDMSLVSYAAVTREIAPALASGDPLREIELQNRLLTRLRAQYDEVARLSRSEQ